MINGFVVSLISSPRTVQVYTLHNIIGDEWTLHTMGDFASGDFHVLFYDGDQLLMCFAGFDPPPDVVKEAVAIMQAWKGKQ